MMENDKVYTGTVIWFSPAKGIGFLEWYIDGVRQKDMFLHFSGIVCEGYKTVLKGQKVSFKIGQNYHGDPIAIETTIV